MPLTQGKNQREITENKNTLRSPETQSQSSRSVPICIGKHLALSKMKISVSERLLHWVISVFSQWVTISSPRLAHFYTARQQSRPRACVHSRLIYERPSDPDEEGKIRRRDFSAFIARGVRWPSGDVGGLGDVTRSSRRAGNWSCWYLGRSAGWLSEWVILLGRVVWVLEGLLFYVLYKFHCTAGAFLCVWDGVIEINGIKSWKLVCAW